MSTKNKVLVFLSASMLTIAAMTAYSLDLKETRELSLSAKGIDLLSIDAHAGYLQVEGVKGQRSIEVVAKLEVNEGAFELSLVEQGGRAVLVANPSKGSKFGWKNDSPVIDLRVTVPDDLPLSVKDGSGPIEISSVAELSIDNGSGSIKVSDIAGSVVIEDGSGDIEINSAAGAVTIDDGAGAIEITNVAGETNINDGSGDIEVTSVSGFVRISDGSGDIILKNLASGAEISEDGSGELITQNIAGPFSSK